MLTIKEICEQAGINVNTFHAWRRANWRLLPEPVGVAKKIIYFDDSILERINFIKEQRSAGKNLQEIQALLDQQLEDSYNPERDRYQCDDDGGRLMDSLTELEEKWKRKDCKNEICLALKLDPALSSPPTVFVDPRSSPSYDQPLVIFTSIISNGHVHFAELWGWIGEKPAEVKRHEKMRVEYYGMFVGQIAQKFAENDRFVCTAKIPGLLIESLNDCCGLGIKEVVDYFKDAKKLTNILKIGQEFAQRTNI